MQMTIIGKQKSMRIVAHSTKTLMIAIFAISCWSCGEPRGDLPVVKEVDLRRYSGRWYEVARLPNSFEKGLECVTATYTLLDGGDIEVINAGCKATDHSRMSTAKGKAWIPDPKEPGKLKVRFFWPFSGAYWIIALDPDYRYVMIGHPSRDYLWILSREKTLDDKSMGQLLSQARADGFDTSKVQMIKQDCN
jgi:apolipoprotein D and lipocalin family protein